MRNILPNIWAFSALRVLLLAVALGVSCAGREALSADRPNVLWITSEDMGPHLACYGDKYAVTPHLDALAARGMRYWNASSTAPVCAAARTVIITGMWAPSLGAEHMRSLVPLPDSIKAYPQYLRQAGYYCTNNEKTDYNVEVNLRDAWDASSGTAHWKNRADDQPFFAIFNLTISHESQIRNSISDEDRIHDPTRAPIPHYHPDTPEVRKDWAQYYDRVTMMDRQAGERLIELAAAGLDEDTIIFYYSDHGSGMPRSKRWLYNSGLGVPLIVYVPPKWQHLAPPNYAPGGSSDRLVSFYDLAPTLLNICGVQPPTHMHGRPFMGSAENVAPAPEHAFGFRGRMDERYDLVRAVRDKRYLYIRNFQPHKPYGQHLDYMFQTPTTRVWKALYDAGQLNEIQARFWQTKPSEELYDLETDRDEVHNLAASPEHQDIVRRMREALRGQLIEWRDTGFLPEGEIHTRAAGGAPWTMAQDESRYPIARVLEMAEVASSMKAEFTPQLIDGLNDVDSAVRYWAAMGLLMRGPAGVKAGHAPLQKALNDPSPAVRVAAAEALGRYGAADDLTPARDLLVDHADVRKHHTFTVMLALNALESLGVEKTAPAKDRIAALPAKVTSMPKRVEGEVARLLVKLQDGFQQRVNDEPSQTRPVAAEDELRFWLENMAVWHRYSTSEMSDVLGRTEDEVRTLLERYEIEATKQQAARPANRIATMPYPGGRHPRIGFLEGAIQPQRETKFSVFTPWDDQSYIVADVPEAVFSNLGLIYLAHTHIPTVWDMQGKRLPQQEWQRLDDGRLKSVRELPNGIRFTVLVVPKKDHIRMELSLFNGTQQRVSDLRVQHCMMLSRAAEFNDLSNDNKIFRQHYGLVHNATRDHWMITSWKPLGRAWGNPPVPCLHTDPKLPDCAPGETTKAQGWLSFYEGNDWEAEIARIEASRWWEDAIE